MLMANVSCCYSLQRLLASTIQVFPPWLESLFGVQSLTSCRKFRLDGCLASLFHFARDLACAFGSTASINSYASCSMLWRSKVCILLMMQKYWSLFWYRS
uniref:Uncharacterized protein n=1 Tax=Opuntia streptacantha TaxID=393608 RepID=A0A7C8ZEH5_OPUST